MYKLNQRGSPRFSEAGVVANFLVMLILLAGLVTGVYLVQKQQIFTPKAQVCTPGSYDTRCTGNCGGCAANAGEQEYRQCNADGNGWGSWNSQCSTTCVGSCVSPTPTPSCTGTRCIFSQRDTNDQVRCYKGTVQNDVCRYDGCIGTVPESCNPTPTPTLLPIMPTIPPDFGAATLNPSCPNNRPTFFVYWRLVSGSRYNISIVDITEYYDGPRYLIGTTQNGTWTGNRFPGTYTPIVNGHWYQLQADNGWSVLTSLAQAYCGANSVVPPCAVSWSLSNISLLQPNTNITVKVAGLSDRGGWQNVGLLKDGSATNITWRGITNPWPTFNYTVNSGAAGAHTLTFKTNNGTKTCTPTVSFTTVNPKQSQK